MHTRTFLFAAVPALLILAGLWLHAGNPRQVLEDKLRNEKKLLLVLSRQHDAAPLRVYSFDRATLATTPLYMIGGDASDHSVYIAGNGRVQIDGKDAGELREQGRLLMAPDATALFVDGVRVPLPLGGWRAFLVGDALHAKPPPSVDYARVRVADGFMRADLFDDSDWRKTSGIWVMKQRGGGMPATEAEQQSFDFQRAVNPFAVHGRENGLLTYGETPMPHAEAEARFFFGQPRTGRLIRQNHVPDDTDMLIVFGQAEGPQVAFGWSGSQGAFALLQRDGFAAPWQTVSLWSDKRPPVSNWVKIGLRLEAGCAVTGYLDGVAVLQSVLDREINGPFHIACGEARIAFDDVHAWSLPQQVKNASPIFVRSRQFANKNKKNDSDPPEFAKWARGSDTFLQSKFTETDHTNAAIIARLPLHGSFTYESVPYLDSFGDLPAGKYRLQLFAAGGNEVPDPSRDQSLFTLDATYGSKGWRVHGVPAWPAGHDEFTLRFRRAADDTVRLQIDGAWHTVSKVLRGPMHVAVVAVDQDPAVTYPLPAHHQIYADNLVHELFEAAPTEWNWLDGSFRMDTRWACQDRWNFMACGSAAVPFMVGKTIVNGDQDHEFFMSLRPAMPWDIGDVTFHYVHGQGENLFKKFGGWYNRRDLNFSFCMDGRNPLSGYAIVFGGDDNSETRLLRRGVVVAKTIKSEHLFKGQEHTGVHYPWWHFRVSKHDNRIRAWFNDQKLFDFIDPQPLNGGHVGFWSVRNGFTVSRYSVAASQLERAPHFLYVANDNTAATAIWQPLKDDDVHLTREREDMTRVAFNGGAGFHAVRHVFDSPVKLQDTPVLYLKLRCDEQVFVNLHLDIDGNPYLLQHNAPVSRTKSLLTPAFETGEQFQKRELDFQERDKTLLLGTTGGAGRAGDTANIRFDVLKALRVHGIEGDELRSVTVGNTSNEGYLLAGFGGNQAHSGYELGEPEFHR